MTTFSTDALAAARARLQAAGLGLSSPSVEAGPEPVHTVYGGAHLFKADIAGKLGTLAIRAFEEHAPDPGTLAAALGLRTDDGGALAGAVHARVLEKLRREPVEDLRIDFEDGYGSRPGEEEDGHAAQAAREVARGMAAKSLPPRCGVRVKPLIPELSDRSLRTLDLFLSTLVAESGGALPQGFVVTLPKVSATEQVAALADALEALEQGLGLAAGALRMELMIETPEALFGPDGALAPRRLCAAGRGRCVAVHFGPYDYTASLGITAAHQRLGHPACDLARQLLVLALAGTGVRVSDGPTNVLPVAIYRQALGTPPISEAERLENRRAVHAAWRLHHEGIRRALEQGIYQGWDLHPAQLPVRYAAVYAFFLEGVDAAAARLRNFLDKAAQATRVGSVFDDAATGQGLLGFFLRAVSAGALSEEEAVGRSTLTLDELRSRSFAAIAASRHKAVEEAAAAMTAAGAQAAAEVKPPEERSEG